MAQKDTDLQKIKELIEIMQENELVEVEIKHGDDKIFLKRSQLQPPTSTTVPMAVADSSAVSAGPGATQIPATGQPAVSQKKGKLAAQDETPVPQQVQDLVEIKSPLVGTFYATPSPDSESYIEVGSQVTEQTVICIIEAMKVMNEIKAEVSGTIAEILVTSGQAVEYGQVLFKVKPD